MRAVQKYHISPGQDDCGEEMTNLYEIDDTFSHVQV